MTILWSVTQRGCVGQRRRALRLLLEAALQRESGLNDAVEFQLHGETAGIALIPGERLTKRVPRAGSSSLNEFVAVCAWRAGPRDVIRGAMAFGAKYHPVSDSRNGWVPPRAAHQADTTFWGQLIRQLSCLSLLEPTVGVVWLAAFSAHVPNPPPGNRYLLLFVALWLVYTADHWLDGVRSGGVTLMTSRHAFARRHSYRLAIGWLLVLLGSLATAWLILTLAEWVYGLLLTTGAGLYLRSVHRSAASRFRLRRRGAKELGVSVLFALGTTFFVWSRGALGGTLLAANVAFGLLVLQNLATIAELERHIDRHHNTPSMASHSGSLRWLLTASWLGLCSACAVFVSVASDSPSHDAIPLYVGIAWASTMLFALSRTSRLSAETSHVMADAAVLAGALPMLWAASG